MVTVNKQQLVARDSFYVVTIVTFRRCTRKNVATSGVDTEGALGAYALPVWKIHNIFAQDFSVMYT